MGYCFRINKLEAGINWDHHYEGEPFNQNIIFKLNQ